MFNQRQSARVAVNKFLVLQMLKPVWNIKMNLCYREAFCACAHACSTYFRIRCGALSSTKREKWLDIYFRALYVNNVSVPVCCSDAFWHWTELLRFYGLCGIRFVLAIGCHQSAGVKTAEVMQVRMKQIRQLLYFFVFLSSRNVPRWERAHKHLLHNLYLTRVGDFYQFFLSCPLLKWRIQFMILLQLRI